jgi:Tol biopolymer transport system component
MALLSLASNEWREVLDDAESARFVGAGYVVFARSGALLAVPFDPARRVTRGSPVPLLERVSHLDGLGAAHFAVSETGTLAYPSASSGVAQARLVWVDRQGRATPIVGDTASYGFPRISPDGRRIAVTVTPDIWVYDLERGNGRRITTDGYNLVPVWNPRGDRITFSAVRAQPAAFFDLHSATADRSSPPELLLAAEGRQFPTSWVPDGRGLLFFEATAAGENIGVLEDGKARSLLAGPYTERGAMPSPDGRWLAYGSDESGEHEVYVTRYPGLAGSERVSIHGGRDPVWSRDGRELFYFQGDVLMVVPIVSAEPLLKTGPPRVLFEWRYSQSRRGYDVAPDGQRFVMIQLPEVTSSHIHLVLNWFQQLERATPTDR